VLIFSWLPKGGVYNFVSRKMWGPGLLWIAGAKLKVYGREKITPDTRCIFYANHSSHFDIPAICTALPVPVYYIAKRELLKIPVFGWGMYAIGMVFVDRSNPERARLSMQKAAKQIEKGKHIITFPEGTRTKSGELQLFKKGTFHLAKSGPVELVPIAVNGTAQVLPPDGKMNRGKIHVLVGEPITIREIDDRTISELTQLAQLRLADTLSLLKNRIEQEKF
jgi:1-acyl-sn-glycerol-3-phosphate acyltransferase